MAAICIGAGVLAFLVLLIWLAGDATSEPDLWRDNRSDEERR